MNGFFRKHYRSVSTVFLILLLGFWTAFLDGGLDIPILHTASDRFNDTVREVFFADTRPAATQAPAADSVHVTEAGDTVAPPEDTICAPDIATPQGDASDTPAIPDEDDEPLGQIADTDRGPAIFPFAIAARDFKDFVNMRSGPDTKFSRIGYMHFNSYGTILNEENGWFKLESGDMTGYVSAGFLITGDEALEYARSLSALFCRVTADSAALYDAPSDQAYPAHVAAYDTSFEYIPELSDSEFYAVKFGYETVYISNTRSKLYLDLPFASTEK